jgi:hypothetical protein
MNRLLCGSKRTQHREANQIIAAGVERLELFELEVVPVNQFPHFT